MAKNRDQFGLYFPSQLPAPFPQKVTLTYTETVTTVVRSDGSKLSRKETTKQISYDPGQPSYLGLPKK